jgi:hypothetical protein
MDHLFSSGENEQAAFLLGREVKSETSTNLLVRKNIFVERTDIKEFISKTTVIIMVDPFNRYEGHLSMSSYL